MHLCFPENAFTSVVVDNPGNRGIELARFMNPELICLMHITARGRLHVQIKAKELYFSKVPRVLPIAFSSDRSPFTLLCLGAHADDIEIGCGGSILRLLDELPNVVVRWIVFSGDEQRAAEARNAAAIFLRGSLRSSVEVLGFRDGYFPFQGAQIKEFFEALKRDINPSLIFTHSKGDAHQDHRLVSELTYTTFRDHLILEYEIPKYDGDLANPNLFLPLSTAHLAKKTATITTCFSSQRDRSWFTGETFLALARLRGIGCRAPDGLAEAFQVNKMVF